MKIILNNNITSEDLTSVLDYCYNATDATVIIFLLKDITLEEIENIKVRDIDFENNTLYYKDRVINLTDKEIEFIDCSATTTHYIKHEFVEDSDIIEVNKTDYIVNMNEYITNNIKVICKHLQLGDVIE